MLHCMTGRHDTASVLRNAERALHWSELAHDEIVAADEAAKRLCAQAASQRMARASADLHRRF
jgi:hypothetical protein